MHETDTANPMLSERYRKDPMRPVSRAELYAWQQQDSLRWKGEYLDMGSCVTFEFNGVTVSVSYTHLTLPTICSV